MSEYPAPYDKQLGRISALHADKAAGLKLCMKRVLAYEKAVGELLVAIADSEAGNEQKALEKLRRLQERI